MLVVAKLKLCVFLGLLAWFASSVTWQLFFFAIYLEPWFCFFTLTRFHPNNFSEYFRTNNKERLQGGFFGFVAVCRFRSILVLFVAGFAMALATHACGAEAEAVRISRLVGLVCCECHIAMFFFAIYLEPWFFFFTLTTMFQNFLDTQHRTAPRGLFRFCCERCGSKVFALCTTWSAVAGQSALVAGGCLLFEARTWLGSGRLGQTDQTVSLF